MTMSEPLMASAAEAPSRTPNSSPALRNRVPAGCGNRMSQAAMVVTPAPRRPEAKAWPASPKPMKQRRGVLRDMDWALLDSDQDSRDGCRGPGKSYRDPSPETYAAACRQARWALRRRIHKWRQASVRPLLCQID